MWEPTVERSRVNYFHGRLLTADDLAAEQAQGREERWLHNRLFHGSGVVTGLEVTADDDDSVSVSPGFALDALGREIVLTQARCLDAASVLPESHGRVQVVIAWAEAPADDVSGPDGPVPSRFVERPHLMLAEHGLEAAPEHAVPLARVFRHDRALVADPSIRQHVHRAVHQTVQTGHQSMHRDV